MFDDFLLIIGGLFFFLYGIKLISTNLSLVTGSFINKILNISKKSNMLSILSGIFLTVIFNSSSCVSVILIVFISSKLIDLKTAMFILMGANIGTCITSYIISLDITKYYMIFIIIGLFILLINKLNKYLTYGNIIFALGIFFMGLNMMSETVCYLILDLNKEFLIYEKNNYIYNILSSTIFTTLIQSSSATIKIIQDLYTINKLDLTASLCFVIGANIGTCITGILASINEDKNGKLLAWFNVTFNLITCIFTVCFFSRYIYFINYLTKVFNLSSKSTITMFHFIFNLTGVILISPIIKVKKLRFKKS